MQVAIPLAANERDPVVPSGDKTRTSDVIAIVITPPLVSFTNVMAVPIGYATEALAGIVQMRAVVSAPGWYMCLPASAKTNV